jgi:hypothetical protein
MEWQESLSLFRALWVGVHRAASSTIGSAATALTKEGESRHYHCLKCYGKFSDSLLYVKMV